MSETKKVFETLLHVNVNDKTEKKKNLTYLSWTYAWSEVKKRFPDATYTIWKDTEGNPYTFSESLGYMCYTTVCIEGETLEMWLPVMNGANKAMRNVQYKYTTQYGEKTVEAATMFDINKTIMRCLVKNIAMFGLGLYIFSGEDLPEEEPIDYTRQEASLRACTTMEQLGKVFKNMSETEQKALATLTTDLKLEIEKAKTKTK